MRTFPRIGRRVARARRRWVGPAATCLLLGTLTAATDPGPALALSRGPLAASAAGCVWSKAPDPAMPVLTTAQVIADVHQHMTFAGGVGPVSNFQCTWDGKKLHKSSPEAPGYAPIFWADFYHSPNEAAAVKLYNEMTSPSGFGPGTPVTGIGNTATFQRGQDIVTEQLVVRSGADVFMTLLSSTEALAAQKVQLAAAARQLVTRLAP